MRGIERIPKMQDYFVLDFVEEGYGNEFGLLNLIDFFINFSF
jgi:hypothetical protein